MGRGGARRGGTQDPSTVSLAGTVATICTARTFVTPRDFSARAAGRPTASALRQQVAHTPAAQAEAPSRGCARVAPSEVFVYPG